MCFVSSLHCSLAGGPWRSKARAISGASRWAPPPALLRGPHDGTACAVWCIAVCTTRKACIHQPWRLAPYLLACKLLALQAARSPRRGRRRPVDAPRDNRHGSGSGGCPALLLPVCAAVGEHLGRCAVGWRAVSRDVAAGRRSTEPVVPCWRCRRRRQLSAARPQCRRVACILAAFNRNADHRSHRGEALWPRTLRRASKEALPLTDTAVTVCLPLITAGVPHPGHHRGHRESRHCPWLVAGRSARLGCLCRSIYSNWCATTVLCECRCHRRRRRRLPTEPPPALLRSSHSLPHPLAVCARPRTHR